MTERRVPWGIRSAVLLLLLLQVLNILILIGADRFITNLARLLPGAEKLNVFLIGALIQLLLTVVLIFLRLRKYDLPELLGLKTANPAAEIRKGFLHGIMLFIFAFAFMILFSKFLPEGVEAQAISLITLEAETAWEKLIPLLITVVIAPLSEELFFRGFLYPAFRQKIGVAAGMIVVSLIFGALHFDLYRTIPLVLGGLWLNILYERSGSLYTSIAAHATWNALMIGILLIAIAA